MKIETTGEIKDGKFVLDDEKGFKTLSDTLKDGKYTLTMSLIKSQRTDQQNRALHLYFTQLAEALNDAGFDMKKTIRQNLEIPWTPHNVKEFLWRPAQKAYLRKQSTTELDKVEDINHVYDIVNRLIGERTGVHVAFPSWETMQDQQK